MRIFPILAALIGLPTLARAQPADCAAPRPAEAAPLALNLNSVPKLPAGGQLYVAVPLAQGGKTCADPRPPPRDILRGEPRDILK